MNVSHVIALGDSPVVAAEGVQSARSSGSGGDSDGNDAVDDSGVLVSGGVGGTVIVWQVRHKQVVVAVAGRGGSRQGVTC